MLYAAGLEPPRHILAHGWWLDKSAAKMSKSGGNVVDPLSLVDKYGPDAFRYVLMRDMTVGQDANFSEESFIQRYNSDLANDLGNLYSRLAKLWEPLKHHWTKQPRAGSYDGTAKNRIVEARTGLRDKVTAYIDALQPNAAIDEIQQVVRLLNQTVEEEKAWKGMGSVFNMIEALETLSEVAKLLEPIMPTKMSELRKLIKPDGQSINPQPNINLFPRIQSRKSTPPSSPTQAGGDTPPSIPPPQAGGDISSLADLSDFIKLDIRIAKVVSAERAPNANKLLLLQVDIGEKDKEHTETPIDKQSGTPKTNTQKEHTETPIDKQSGAPKTITQLDEQTGAINVIQLVAGIGDAYTPEELVGRRIVVLVNLKPAVIRGHRSEGMLLAAGDDKALALLSVDKELPPGVRIR
jgi:methionyl-tRNA synthetase